MIYFFNKSWVCRDAQPADVGVGVYSYPEPWPEPELPREGVCRSPAPPAVSFGLKRSGGGAEKVSLFIFFCLLEAQARLYSSQPIFGRSMFVS